MRVRKVVVSLILGLVGATAVAAPAHAGCGSGPIAVLYKKITGEELIHCS